MKKEQCYLCDKKFLIPRGIATHVLWKHHLTIKKYRQKEAKAIEKAVLNDLCKEIYTAAENIIGIRTPYVISQIAKKMFNSNGTVSAKTAAIEAKNELFEFFKENNPWLVKDKSKIFKKH